MNVSLEDLLRRAVDAGASDIHLKVGSPPALRIGGELVRLQDYESLRPADTESLATALFTQKSADQFKETGEADFAYGRQDLGRFRVNCFRQRGSVSLVLRRVTPGVPSLEELGLPPVVRKLAAEPFGLILVTGPSGSGRTTTIAAILQQINSTRPVSIVTVEDPIEVLFPDQLAIVVQREVGVDAPSFGHAIGRAVRQDADVIMVSEINDTDTAQAAVAAAETGHLVVAAMHTADPFETISRLVSFFPPHLQAPVRVRIAGLLRGIISQRLIESSDGDGQVMSAEILTGTPKMAEKIIAGAAHDELLQLVVESEFFGMQTFDKSLLDLVRSRRISLATALPHVRNSHEFRAKALQAGIEI